MTAVPSLWRLEESKLHLSLHPGQAAAWRCDRRFVAMIAGTQSGKTSFGPLWLHREIQRRGDGDYLAVSSSFDLLRLKMLPALLQVYEHLLGIGRFWSGSRVLELKDPETGKFWARRADDPMWGRIILRSAAAEGSLESATAKAAWLDEAGQDEFTGENWEAVLRRLSLSQGRVLVTTTPYNLGWLKTELYDRWIAGDPDVGVIQFDSIENPVFPRAEYDRAERTMPAHRFAMFYRGQFARPHGLIYGCFDELHLVDPFPLPPRWPRYAGADFGGQNTALVWLAHDPSADCYYVIDESLGGGKSSGEHAREAQARASGANLVACWGGAPSEDQQRSDFTTGGFKVRRPPISDLEAGISRVIELFKERRLFVFRSCRGLRDELGSYRRKLDESGQPTDEIEDKRKFHRLDALRYAACGLLGGGRGFFPYCETTKGRDLYGSSNGDPHTDDLFRQTLGSMRGTTPR